MGPTASGKTAAAIELVQKYPLEIISVDSAMIYKGMDIGTGKPTKEELSIAPHHLIDFLDPTNAYSAADFCKDALRLIQDIHQRNKIPLLVGGTMMYFNALIHGLDELPKAEPSVRQKLMAEREEVGLEKMHERLKSVDPITAQKINPRDPQRLLRALEVYEITGKPMSVLQGQKKSALEDYEITQLAIIPDDRAALHQAIEQRFLTMLEQGFVEEVKSLKQRGDLDLEKPSMRCVGYRQIWQHLDNELDEATMKNKALAATRQLAKRQLTWLRSWQGIDFQAATSKQLTQYFLSNGV